MKRIPFNEGWAFKRQGDSHEFNLTWEKVTLPHDAIIGTERSPEAFNGTKKAFFKNGSFEYVKVFSAPEEWKGKCVYLEFEGVLSHAMLYVNGDFVTSHAYGYTEFTADLTNFLICGEKNVIKLLCRTEDDSRWYTGAGIYRGVNLMVAEKLHIANNGVRVTTLSATESAANISVETRLSSYEECLVTAKIYFEGQLVAEQTAKACGVCHMDFRIINPKLWSAETPNLYTVEVTSGGDCAKETFGIRTLFVSADRGLEVNGKQVKLRGACVHHDSGVLGSATYRDFEFRRIRLLKAAGFNAVRSAHHPMGRYLLEACDKLGMYVMEEAFDMWQIPKSCGDYSNDFNENWKGDIAAMVAKDYNRPSVIMYSIGNEISDLASKGGVKLAGEISAEVKRQDSTRFTTLAINGLLLIMQKMEQAALLKGETGRGGDVNQNLTSLDDAMVSINNSATMDKIIEGGCGSVDIAGYNYMHHRYSNDLKKCPNRVIVGSETYLKYIPEMWEHIKNNNNVLGDFTWTGWDYLGETGIGLVSYTKRDYHDGFYAGYPCLTAYCGDLDITGFRRPQSYFREIVFGLREQPYIAVCRPEYAGKEQYLSTWGWEDAVSSWSFSGFENTALTVYVYADSEVELFLNGASLGKKTPQNYKALFIVPYAPGTLRAEYVSDRTKACELKSACGGIRFNVECEEGEKLIFADILLTDENGITLYGKDRLIKIAVEGGTLLGFGSGSPLTEESFTSGEYTSFDGRAFAIILKGEGEVKLTLSADGVQSKEIII